LDDCNRDEELLKRHVQVAKSALAEKPRVVFKGFVPNPGQKRWRRGAQSKSPCLSNGFWCGQSRCATPLGWPILVLGLARGLWKRGYLGFCPHRLSETGVRLESYGQPMQVTFTAPPRYKGYMSGGSTWNDEALMRAYAGGDGAAFDELFKRYGTGLFNFLLRATGDRAKAEDLFQATFLHLHLARKNYVVGTFKAFLFTIAANLLKDERSRAEHRRRTNMDEEAIEAITAGSRSTDSDPEALIQAHQTSKVLESAIEQLPEGMREVLLLSRYQGLANREIASALGISEGAVKVRLFRALAQLRAVLCAPDTAAGRSGNE
jgi:RNA polymerase sigma-70 factor (ECF subfamily)